MSINFFIAAFLCFGILYGLPQLSAGELFSGDAPVTEKTKNNRIKHDNNLISGTSHSSHQRFITCAAGFPSIVNPLSPAGSSWNCGR